ncbi:MAG: hypothetical protein QW404_03930 [Candidatus Nanoarchaeia archaeon]
MNKYIMLTLLVIILVSGCKNNISETNNSAQIGTETTKILVQNITHKDFTIIKPKSWKETSLPQATLYKYFPPEVNSSDARPENIMIIVDNTPKDKSIEEVIKLIVEGSQDLKITEGPKPAKLGPLEGMMIRTEKTFDGEKMESIQIFAKNDKKMYAMTYSCMAGNCKNYHIFEMMAKSFQPK